MSYSTVKQWTTAIADAIRTKDGTTAPINHQDIPDRISAIETGMNWADVFTENYDKNLVIDFRGYNSIPRIRNLFGRGNYSGFISSLTVYHDSARYVSFENSSFMNNSDIAYIRCCNVGDIGAYAFQATTVAGEVSFGDVRTKISSNAFRSFSCDSIVFGSITGNGIESSAFRDALIATFEAASINNIGYGAFSGCSNLTAFIIRGGNVPTLNSNVFDNTPIASGSGYIYVPASMVSAYQAATNWSTYASQIRALEDYTVDGTVTGELDPTKI